MITSERIAKVGRQYVTLKDPGNTKYAVHGKADYLVEVINYGVPRYLFPSEKAAKEYLEKRELEVWLKGALRTIDGKYSLEQLRKVKAVLRG